MFKNTQIDQKPFYTFQYDYEYYDIWNEKVRKEDLIYQIFLF